MYIATNKYHEKPERYEEAEPNDVRAPPHSRRLGTLLVLATGAARHLLRRCSTAAPPR